MGRREKEREKRLVMALFIEECGGGKSLRGRREWGQEWNGISTIKSRYVKGRNILWKLWGRSNFIGMKEGGIMRDTRRKTNIEWRRYNVDVRRNL